MDLVIELDVELRRVILDRLPYGVQSAFPLVLALSIVSIRHDGDERRFIRLLRRLFIGVLDESCVVRQNADLHRATVLLVALCHLRKSVAHDRNDHIQRRDRRGERRQAEEDPAEDVEHAVVVVVDHVVLAERDQILIDHHVDVFILDVVINDFCSVVRLLCEDEHGRTEGVQEDKEDAEERKDVLDRVVDERDILARIVKHSEPVKHLHPHDDHDERARRSLRDIIH